MLFNSLKFAVFLPIVFSLYHILNKKNRWIVLLAASYYFYMSWEAKYVVLILFTTVISYFCAIFMEKCESKAKKKLCLVITLICCLCVLFFFKYYNFTMENLNVLFDKLCIPLHQNTLNVLLPVGISFYTFQTLSYVIDVYRGDVEVEHHFGVYATFVSFFPQLVAGPIERTSNLLYQIKQTPDFDYNNAIYGLKLMAWGFFKKIAIADVLASVVDMVFNDLYTYKGFALVIAVFCFTIQIYCDFSGYSDVAIGTAKLFNINLMRNFRSPYFSTSIKEFWSRWHISLSTWFRDYVYIPLGGNRCGKNRQRFNLIVTFLLSGLWHGANWTFVFWGGLHGIAQAIENLFIKNRNKSLQKKNHFLNGLKIIIVFAFCNITWIFFRAETIEDAFYVIRYALSGCWNLQQYFDYGIYILGLSDYWLLKSSILLLILAVFDYCNLKVDVIKRVGKWNMILRWSVYIIITFFVLIAIPVESGQQFIYFQF